MMTIAHTDVKCIIERVNAKLPQPSKTTKREFKADYARQYGGQLIYFYDQNGKGTAPMGNYRVSTKEAYRFFEGIEYSLSRL